MKASLKKTYASLGADGLVALWLGVWWVCNLLQAGFSELANDEAYGSASTFSGANWACGFSLRCCNRSTFIYYGG